PFPIPSPGLCPAPTITATLSSRRMGALLATGVQGCLYGASLRKSARASRLLAYRILYPRCARVAGREAWEPEPGRPGTRRRQTDPVAELDFDRRQAQVHHAPGQAGLGNDINAGSAGFQKAPTRGPASLVSIL